jgi:hypothetical protein
MYRIWRIVAAVIVSLFITCVFAIPPAVAQDPTPPPGENKPSQPMVVYMSAPDTRGFPLVNSFLELQIPHFSQLNTSDLVLTEDDKPVTDIGLKIIKPGVQLVVAINPNEMFDLRDSNGRSRYDQIAQSIQSWASSKPAPGTPQVAQPNQPNPMDGSDDLSLLTTTGIEITHISNYQEWLKSFQTFSPGKSSSLNFDILVKSIDLALDKSPQEGMGRAILLITAPPGKEDASAFDNLITRANEQQVHVFVWMIASPGYFSSQGALGLNDLATKTGGKMFMFSGLEPIPNPDELLDPLRDIYLLSYVSRIRNSGDHKLMVQVNANGQVFNSETRSFYLTIAPPQPMFVSPPREIIRTIELNAPGQDGKGPKNNGGHENEILPEQYPLQILVDYPDGFRRDIKQSTLYIDGQLAVENKVPPFDRFSWDLTKFPAGGDHLIQVEVVDQLGLNNVSIETPVRIRIQSQKQSLSAMIAQQGKFIALVAVALAGILLFWALVLGGRLHPKTFFLDTREKITNRRYLDPVTQPVLIRSEPVTRPRFLSVDTNSRPIPGAAHNTGTKPLPGNEFTPQSSVTNIYSKINEFESRFNYPWQTRREDTKDRAYLIRLIDVPGTSESAEDSKPFTIIAKEVIIGSNPLKATLVIEDSSVDGVHARLMHIDDGSFVVCDLGSTAGTWVNYAPISTDGARLDHGDLLHIGKVGFRFARTVALNPPKRTVITQRVPRN